MDAAVKIYADPQTRLLRADVYTDLAAYGVPPGSRAADAGSALGAQHLWLSGSEIQLLTEHHDGDHHYFLLTEREPFGRPGNDEILALHVIINTAANTFTTHGDWNSTLAFAQRRLIAEGCPGERTTLGSEYSHIHHADATSQEINRRVRDSGDRYRVRGTFTHHDHLHTETWTVTEDTHARPGDNPVHVFLETFHITEATYQIRDLPFPHLDAADAWLSNRLDDPHPPLIPAPARPNTPPAVAPTPPSRRHR
ncbi:hypothetical protein LO772_29600 [Yinghuangia sp. ASG 101]|uniref:hypothetical protein n=1 Tax=Yinghuangia sp. ASG 101 TaxID=2896848 RepID=UPI001E33E4C2|nr:hypothetical protein [Yinghuangia sp. ASG 101]UGQ10927.1 hypothetical protein LO772_29600 [Yinghuangia sp. ASG 101]